MKLLLHNLIYEEHLFTLDYLNQHLQSFDYGYSIVKNKPTVISSSHLQSRESILLGQSGKIVCGFMDYIVLLFSYCTLNYAA